MRRIFGIVLASVISASLSIGVIASNAEESASRNNSDVYTLAQQMKGMRGDIEQLQHELATLNEKFTRFSADMEMRLNELAANKSAKQDGKEAVANTTDKPTGTETATSTSKPTAVGTAEKDGAKDTKESKGNAEADYQAAYTKYKNKDLPGAEGGFQNFIKNYPSHKLVSGAHYWLGEIHATQGNYEKAVVEYLKGYQQDPKGLKAADNLLKLGVSLSKLDKKKEACVTFDKLRKECSDASQSILQQAMAEQKRLHCE